MIPPYQQRGNPVSPSAFNMLIDSVRSALITGINGGTFQRSIGGTNINIASSTGGSSGAAPICAYFQVKNVSEQEILKVEVAQNLVASRWPDGMGIGYPPYILEISESCYIYLMVVYDTTELTILPESDAITIFQSSSILPNETNAVYILLATVLVGGAPAKILTINNVCTEPVPNPCNLAWTQ